MGDGSTIDRLFKAIGELRQELHAVRTHQQHAAGELSEAREEIKCVREDVGRIETAIRGSIEEPDRGLLPRVKVLEDAEENRAENSRQAKAIAWGALGTAVTGIIGLIIAGMSKVFGTPPAP